MDLPINIQNVKIVLNNPKPDRKKRQTCANLTLQFHVGVAQPFLQLRMVHMFSVGTHQQVVRHLSLQVNMPQDTPFYISPSCTC